MLFASKIRWAGIAFALLTTGMLYKPSLEPQPAYPTTNKEGVPAFVIKNEVKKIQRSPLGEIPRRIS